MMRENRNSNIINDGEGRKITGYAIVFNSQSVPLRKDGLTFTEIILPEAITQEVVDNSDVLCLLNHNTEKVLGRCKNGKGSLTLELDERGLKFSLELPNSPLGDEVLEGIKRGDLSTCSFAFTVAEGGEEWTVAEDGSYIRTIKEINALYDVSVVWQPAYEQTSIQVDTRGLEKLIENKNLNKEKKMAKRTKEEIIELLTELLAETDVEEANQQTAEEEVIEETNVEAEEESEDEVRNDEEEMNEEVVEECSEEESEDEEATEEEKIEEKNKSKRRKKLNTMEKRFSLISAINDMAQGKPMSEVTRLVDAEGRKQQKLNGFKVTKGLVLPMEAVKENRAAVVAGLDTQGKENVQTDVLNLLEPLRANLALAKAGSTVMTGLVGNVSIPKYSGTNVAWKGEVVSADDGAGDFDSVTLTPKRLTAYIDVSMEFLNQTSNGAEEILRRDLIEAISEKLEATLLGDGEGNANQPAGLFNGVSAEGADVTFGDIVDIEEELDSANVSNNRSYILSPKAKAILRTTSKDAGSGRFIMEQGEIEGIATEVTSNVVAKGVVLGDWKEYVIAQWGGIELTVDPYTKATEGCVRLVVNSYWDGAARREEAFAKRILK